MKRFMNRLGCLLLSLSPGLLPAATAPAPAPVPVPVPPPVQAPIPGPMPVPVYSPTAPYSPGQMEAWALNERYGITMPDCGSPSRPAFLCWGVILRATTLRPFWAPVEKNLLAGAMSASYLRKDAKFSKLAWERNSGFILRPILANPRPTKPYEVLCSFPSDAGTDDRADKGCTDHKDTAPVEDYCENMGIRTGQDWASKYGGIAANHRDLCGFDVRDNRDALAGPAFMASIEARNLVGQPLFHLNNEFRITTWGNNPPEDPPVESLFYTLPPSSDSSGLESARLNQIDWWNATHQYLPLILMHLPQTLTADATFIYNAADQVIQPTTWPNQCAKYFENAYFTDLPGQPGRKTLVVVPSDCGRHIGEDQTNNFFNELVARMYSDPTWQGASDYNVLHVLSMRRQLTCYLAYRRFEPSWSLAPHRAFVSFEESVARSCEN